jgi:hypothetical protein
VAGPVSLLEDILSDVALPALILAAIGAPTRVSITSHHSRLLLVKRLSVWPVPLAVCCLAGSQAGGMLLLEH